MAGTMTAPADKILDAVATGDAPVLETLMAMQMDTFERSGLDEKQYMIARIAALVATDAAPASYLANLKVAMDAGLDRETVAAVLVAIAPVVGSAHVVSAASKMARAKLLGEELERKIREQYAE